MALVVAVQPGDYFTVRAFQNTGAPLSSDVNLSIVALGPPLGPEPTIMNVNPTARGVGQSVTITGFHFGVTQGTSSVRFSGWAATGDVLAAVTAWSDTSITAVVPATAIAGPVKVRVGNQDSNGVSFTLVPSPAIVTMSTSWANTGDSVTLAGAHFGAGGTVTFTTSTGTVAVSNAASQRRRRRRGQKNCPANTVSPTRTTRRKPRGE